MSESPRGPTLEFVAHARVDLGVPLELGAVPRGQRRIIPIVGGSIEGPLLNAEILEGGADWQIVGNDGTAVIDTRYSARTPDGDVVFLATRGFRHAPPDVIARLAEGADVPEDEYYFRLAVELESGAPALRWISRTVFIASAARRSATVEYDLFAVR